SASLSSGITAHAASVRMRALAATARLVQALSAVGARHHDLNVKNVLLHSDDTGVLTACVLDVDRVVFAPGPSSSILERNLARLLRSARKWRDRYSAPVTESELTELARVARERG